MSTEWWLIYVDDCDWGTRDSNGVAKVSVLLWRYADLRKVIIFDVSAVMNWIVTVACAVAQRRGVNPEV
jgi:hypothetical protein